MDDALSMLHLFAKMPADHKLHSNRVAKCERLCREWQAYIIKTRSLKKVFVSIKGIYYQAEVAGKAITWLVPHYFSKKISKDIDLSAMLSFLELYEHLTGFVLYKLYNDIGLRYPPLLHLSKERNYGGLDALLLQLEEQAGVALDSTTPNNEPSITSPDQQVTHTIAMYFYSDSYSLLCCLFIAVLFTHCCAVYSLLCSLLIAVLYTHCCAVYSLLCSSSIRVFTSTHSLH
jgi:pescadillo protein